MWLQDQDPTAQACRPSLLTAALSFPPCGFPLPPNGHPEPVCSIPLAAFAQHPASFLAFLLSPLFSPPFSWVPGDQGELSVHSLPPPEQERHEGSRRVALLSDISTVGQRVAELGSMTRSTKDLNCGLS